MDPDTYLWLKGSGSLSWLNGSGSGRPKNTRILRIRIRSTDNYSQFFLTSEKFMTVWCTMFIPDPGSGIEKNPGSRIWDEHCASYFQKLSKIFWCYKYLNSFMRIQIRDLSTQDPGWSNSDPGWTSQVHNTGQIYTKSESFFFFSALKRNGT
jgi:hypothetical protein